MSVDSSMIKTFSADVRKADRVLTLRISDGVCSLSVINDIKGEISVVVSTEMDAKLKINLEINSDKFLSAMKTFKEWRLFGDTLWVVDEESGLSKFIKVEVI